MANELVVLKEKYEGMLAPVRPQLQDLLEMSRIPVAAFEQAAIICATTGSDYTRSQLAKCPAETFVASVMSLAVIGLIPDGLTGQSWILPFKNRATPVIGYKGYNTLASRAGYAITGEIVRAGDHFDYRQGSKPWVDYKAMERRPGEPLGDITHAYAVATKGENDPVYLKVLTIADLMDAQARSPSFSSGKGPWFDYDGPGFVGMCLKTPKRALATEMPIKPLVQAAALESWQDRHGGLGYLDARGQAWSPEPDAEPKVIDAKALTGPTEFKITDTKGHVSVYGTEDAFKARWQRIGEHFIEKANPEAIEAYQKANEEYLRSIGVPGAEVLSSLKEWKWQAKQ